VTIDDLRALSRWIVVRAWRSRLAEGAIVAAGFERTPNVGLMVHDH
jgi:hypothetical protein